MIISSLNSNDSIREDFRTEEPDTPGQCCGSEEEEEEGDDVSMERGREGEGGGKRESSRGFLDVVELRYLVPACIYLS